MKTKIPVIENKANLRFSQRCINDVLQQHCGGKVGKVWTDKATMLSFTKYVLNYVQPKPIIKQPQTRHFIFVFFHGE